MATRSQGYFITHVSLRSEWLSLYLIEYIPPLPHETPTSKGHDSDGTAQSPHLLCDSGVRTFRTCRVILGASARTYQIVRISRPVRRDGRLGGGAEPHVEWAVQHRLIGATSSSRHHAGPPDLAPFRCIARMVNCEGATGWRKRLFDRGGARISRRMDLWHPLAVW